MNRRELGKYSVSLQRISCDYAYLDLQPFLADHPQVTVKGMERDVSAITIDAEPKGGKPNPLDSQAALTALTPKGAKMLHTPSQGKMWGPCIFWHEGAYCLYAMHNAGKGDFGMWGAKSADGTHWQELGPVIADAPFIVSTMFVMHNGEHFIAAHGSFSRKPGSKNDTQRHWKSFDGVNWEYLGEETDTHPDPRWYNETGRWDCMYMAPRRDGTGWMGYTVATMAEKSRCGFSRLESKADVTRLSWTG